MLRKVMLSAVRRGTVVSEVGGGVNRLAAGDGVVGVSAGTVVTVALTVVSVVSWAAGWVVAVAPDEREPDPEPDPDEPDPEDPDDEAGVDVATEATGETALPPSGGTVPFGVSSGALALDMYRLKIWAGRDPPLTLVTPWML